MLHAVQSAVVVGIFLLENLPAGARRLVAVHVPDLAVAIAPFDDLEIRMRRTRRRRSDRQGAKCNRKYAKCRAPTFHSRLSSVLKPAGITIRTTRPPAKI